MFTLRAHRSVPRLILQMRSWQACEQLSEAGVRSRYPDVDDHEVRLRVFALRLGRELMVKVYDWDPAIEGW